MATGTSKKQVAGPEHLPPYVLLGDSDEEETSSLPTTQEREHNVGIQPAVLSSRTLKEQVKEFERALIDNAIDRLGSKRKAARALGVDIGTIVRKTQGGQAPPRRH
jgi:transcriptional regulator with PAS, ATPase and Fis domain